MAFVRNFGTISDGKPPLGHEGEKGHWMIGPSS